MLCVASGGDKRGQLSERGEDYATASELASERASEVELVIEGGRKISCGGAGKHGHRANEQRERESEGELTLPAERATGRRDIFDFKEDKVGDKVNWYSVET